MIVSGHAAEFETKHKLVLHVVSRDLESQKVALNNAANILKYYGPENITVEVVANGPGLTLLTKDSKQAERIPALIKNGVRMSACGVTMKKMEKKTGKPVALIEGVQEVPAGLARIIELQEQGYAYARP